MDWINEHLIARGTRGLGTGLWKGGDQGIIDGAIVDGSWKAIGRIAGVVRWMQSGYIYHYAFAMLLGIFILMTYFVWFNR
jgi:NADH-quinone oxidoreductase subunit L